MLIHHRRPSRNNSDQANVIVYDCYDERGARVSRCSLWCECFSWEALLRQYGGASPPKLQLGVTHLRLPPPKDISLLVHCNWTQNDWAVVCCSAARIWRLSSAGLLPRTRKPARNNRTLIKSENRHEFKAPCSTKRYWRSVL